MNKSPASPREEYHAAWCESSQGGRLPPAASKLTNPPHQMSLSKRVDSRNYTTVLAFPGYFALPRKTTMLCWYAIRHVLSALPCLIPASGIWHAMHPYQSTSNLVVEHGRVRARDHLARRNHAREGPGLCRLSVWSTYTWFGLQKLQHTSDERGLLRQRDQRKPVPGLTASYARVSYREAPRAFRDENEYRMSRANHDLCDASHQTYIGDLATAASVTGMRSWMRGSAVHCNMETAQAHIRAKGEPYPVSPQDWLHTPLRGSNLINFCNVMSRDRGHGYPFKELPARKVPEPREATSSLE